METKALTQTEMKETESLPEIHVEDFATADNNNDNAFSFDTYGIPLVIDNSATAIICNVRKIFIGPFFQANVAVEAVYGLSSKT